MEWCVGTTVEWDVGTSVEYCGAGCRYTPFCLVFPRELCWVLFYSSFILTISQGTLCLAQNSLQMI